MVTAGGERFAVRTNRSEIAMRDFMLGVLLLSSLLLRSCGKSLWLTQFQQEPSNLWQKPPIPTAKKGRFCSKNTNKARKKSHEPHFERMTGYTDTEVMPRNRLSATWDRSPDKVACVPISSNPVWPVNGTFPSTPLHRQVDREVATSQIEPSDSE